MLRNSFRKFPITVATKAPFHTMISTAPKPKNRDKIISYKKQDGSFTYLINGGALAFYSSKIKKIDGSFMVIDNIDESYIPLHRIRKVAKNNAFVWERK